jgi:hypothetical protein
MLHHGASLLSDGADGTFSDAILMVRADAGEVELLIDQRLPEYIRLENPVVSAIALDLLATRLGDRFEGPF